MFKQFLKGLNLVGLPLGVLFIEVYDFKCCRIVKKIESRLVFEKILKLFSRKAPKY